jgi:hypothetical protein
VPASSSYAVTAPEHPGFELTVQLNVSEFAVNSDPGVGDVIVDTQLVLLLAA